MSFDVVRIDAGRFRLEGELDLSTVPILAQAVEADGPVRDDLVLELDGLTFVDSSGVRGILTLADGLAPGNEVVLLRPGVTVARVFELMGLHRHPRLRVERGD